MLRLKFATTGALLIALICLLRVPALSQEEKPQMLRLAYAKVYPDMMGEFGDVQKIINDALKKSGLPWRQVWGPSVFGEAGFWVAVTPVRNYAQFDQENPMWKALGDRDFERYLNRARHVFGDLRYSLVVTVPELSIASDRTEPPTLARITQVRVLPGKNAAFEAMIKTQVLPALKQAGVKDYWVNRTVLGSGGEYTFVHVFDKWAELDALPTTPKLLGAEGFKAFMQGVAETVQSSESFVMRHVPEYSFSTSP
jgi:hypothetical protein